MNNLKNKQISPELAELARKAEFENNEYPARYDGEEWYNEKVDVIDSTTLSVLQEWLYETKLLWVEPIYNDTYKWFQCVIYDLRTNDCLGDVFGEKSKTPFEALEVGLQEALKYLIIMKT